MQPLGGAVFVLDGILIGAGDVRYLALAMAGATLCFIPCALAVLLTGRGLSRCGARSLSSCSPACSAWGADSGETMASHGDRSLGT